MSYLYATLLPTGVTKIGLGSHPSRAFAAQTYFAEPVKVLKIWDGAGCFERLAHDACRRFKAEGGGTELFRGPPNEIVRAVDEALSELIESYRNKTLTAELAAVEREMKINGFYGRPQEEVAKKWRELYAAFHKQTRIIEALDTIIEQRSTDWLE